MRFRHNSTQFKTGVVEVMLKQMSFALEGRNNMFQFSEVR